MSLPTSGPEIPHIITTDLSSSFDLDEHADRSHADSLPPPSDASALGALAPLLSDHKQHLSSPTQFLSPAPIPRASSGSSFEASYSPTLSPTLDNRSPSPSYAGSVEGSSSNTHVPPSPTLSHVSSANFSNSPVQRDTKQDRDSRGFLSPPTQPRKHGRSSSAASAISLGSADGAEPEPPILEYHLQPLKLPQSPYEPAPASPTHSHFDRASEFDGTTVRSRSGSAHSRQKLLGASSHSHSDEQLADAQHPVAGISGHISGEPPENPAGPEAEDEEPTHVELDLSADDDVDTGPFEFKPVHLAALVDPKSLEQLEEMGGIKGLLRGLGTDAKRGLSAHALDLTEEQAHFGRPASPVSKAHDDRPGAGTHPGAGEGASQRHDRQPNPGGRGRKRNDVPGIVVTGPASEVDLSAKQSVKSVTEVTEEEGEEPWQKGKAYEATLEERKRVYGENVLPIRKTKSLLELMWLAMKDKVLILLTIAAVVSLALGLFEDFGTPREPGQPPVDWVEGVAIVIAIVIVVSVGSVNDWQKERQFQALNEKKEERGVKVIRAGEERVVDVHEVVVGDVALVEPGEIIPCDGVFLSGHNVRCDESGATGESDAIRKISYDEAIAMRNERMHGESGPVAHGHHHQGHSDCFMVSGSKVLEGYGSYVVIAVGTKSFNGRIMMALRGDTENTPLQLKLNDLAELIAKAGSAAGLLLFIALMIKFFVQLGTNNPPRTANQKGIAFVDILIISVTLVVVAVPEGLPLAVTLALAFATKRMTKENLLVRVLGSCETMANASVVCTDKTGTLTQNSMTIVTGTIGIHCKFVKRFEENPARANVDAEAGDFAIDQTELNDVLSEPMVELLNDAIAVNSTAFEDADPETGVMAFVGSKTETALLKFAKENEWADYKQTRDAAEIIQMIPFSSARKAMGVVVRLPDGRYRLHLKGASEILTKRCSRYVVVERGGKGPDVDALETREVDEKAGEGIARTTVFYAEQMLRAIALCYRDFDIWPPKGARYTAIDEVEYEDLAKELTLIGIVGIEDPLREGVRDAVADCHKAGVTVKMCTGDNILTAKSIAQQCGILTPGGVVLDGPSFRKLNDQQLLATVPKLQVLARSSPEDKKLLVEKLRELGEIVGVTGDGTNDGPALKTADVGFSMGIAGTEVAKEASDIILMDDNFASIVKAIMWGRCVNDAVRKFLQFQISTNITAVVITFVSTIASGSESPVLTAVQLLWINIIMDTFAALALATDPASPELLDRKPDKKTAPLFSVDMYKQIIGQSIYQIVIVLLFHFLGDQIFAFDPSADETNIQTVVFNIFVFAQISNSFNCRRLDNHLNIFEGISRNYYFIGITLIEIAGQVLIVFVGGDAFSVERIDGAEWGISLALGFVSIPLGALIRLIPNKPIERFFIFIHLLPNPEVLPTKRPEGDWNAAYEIVRDNLSTFAQVRGGRMRASSYVGKSRKARPPPEAQLTMPSIMTMVPTFIASSVGAGWTPPMRTSLSDSPQRRSRRSIFFAGRSHNHSGSLADTPAIQRLGSRQ
ncbi:calcium-translocating P-type ATPase [Laetiporus sulphureus 93-53]|uniref:Calcium-transporting ATPase n=1 Tax=Laetiporus sulphureus 93-53 TaxID=1314785 RepID=A0A165BNT3_9APHY|nr:calcium-translocating P-type ATPase [Laetiporus sulphureus 93-53]KZT01381.1 calcium-translocating P-type ATPase [Laetiporus sulphureus 93-53]